MGLSNAASGMRIYNDSTAQSLHIYGPPIGAPELHLSVAANGLTTLKGLTMTGRITLAPITNASTQSSLHMVVNNNAWLNGVTIQNTGPNSGCVWLTNSGYQAVQIDNSGTGHGLQMLNSGGGRGFTLSQSSSNYMMRIQGPDDGTGGDLFVCLRGIENSLTVPANGAVRLGTPIGPAVTGPGNVNISGNYFRNGVSLNTVPIAFIIPGQPSAGQAYHVPIVLPLSIPANLAGSQIYFGTADTSGPMLTYLFRLQRVRAGVVTTLGDISRPSAVTFSGVGGDLQVGDILRLLAPTAQDSTMADIGITILAERA
jgi:hypothetical protein